MTTLAFDTATPRPSLVVADGDRTLAEQNLGAIEGGGRRVLEAVHGVLGEADVDVDALERIIVGVGPGGFTGIRIGIATALGLGHALGVPVIGASSLEALALGIARAQPRAEIVAPVIDARRREVFAGIYAVSSNLDERRAPHAVAPADFSKAVLALTEDAVVAVGGNGLEAYSDAFEGLVAVSLPADSSANFPKAIDLVRRVDDGEGLPARPFYCRLPDVEEKRLAREAANE